MSKTRKSKKVRKMNTKRQEQTSVAENTEKANLNVLIPKELREWAKDDARRCGYSFPEYIAQLITERKQIAPPIQKVSLLQT